jgi:hypothetical protein
MNAFGKTIESDEFIADLSTNLAIDLDLAEQEAGVYFLEFSIVGMKKSEIIIKTK